MGPSFAGNRALIVAVPWLWLYASLSTPSCS